MFQSRIGVGLFFDSTKEQANANIKRMIERAQHATRQQTERLFEASNQEASSLGPLIAKYNGKRLHGIRKPRYNWSQKYLLGQEGDCFVGKNLLLAMPCTIFEMTCTFP